MDSPPSSNFLDGYIFSIRPGGGEDIVGEVFFTKKMLSWTCFGKFETIFPVAHLAVKA